jgi:DNA-binding transcriptional LysR family regulator
VLDVRRLQALHAVVTTGSVKEAAFELGYSASAISQHIAALQRETETTLLEPAGRGVRATPAGQLLADHAARIFERMAEAEAELRALNAGELGALRLASFATAGAELVPPAIAQVQADLPGIEITLRTAEREDALALLRRGMIDVAVIEAHDPASERNGDGLVYRPFGIDQFRLLLPHDHRLAKKRAIRLAEVASEPWIDLRCEITCCRAATTAAFQQAGFTPRRVAEADDYWPAQGFVAAGLGLALVPTLALGITHANVVARRLDPMTQPSRNIFAATRSTMTATTAIQAILTALTAAAAQHPHFNSGNERG